MQYVCSACEADGTSTHFETVDTGRGDRFRCPETGHFATVEPAPEAEEIDALRRLIRTQAREQLSWGDNALQTATGESIVEDEIETRLENVRESSDWNDPSFWADLFGVDEEELLD